MPNRSEGSYNTLHLLPLIPYNIITYLIDNNEEIWKLLKYQTADAWAQPNLTADEKRALVYNGQNNMEDYRVFMTSGQDSAWTSEACILRIPIVEVYPVKPLIANVVIGFEVYCHAAIGTLSNYQTRVDTIMQELVATLNQVEVGGLGKLYFDSKSSGRCRIMPIGNIPFRGKVLTMANWMT